MPTDYERYVASRGGGDKAAMPDSATTDYQRYIESFGRTEAGDFPPSQEAKPQRYSGLSTGEKALKSFWGGVGSGMWMGLQPTDENTELAQSEYPIISGAGSLAGSILPVGAAYKAAAIPVKGALALRGPAMLALSKAASQYPRLTQALGQAMTSLLAGGAENTVRQGVEIAKSERDSFSPTEVAGSGGLWAGLDLVFRGAGGVIGKALKVRSKEKLVKNIREMVRRGEVNELSDKQIDDLWGIVKRGEADKFLESVRKPPITEKRPPEEMMVANERELIRADAKGAPQVWAEVPPVYKWEENTIKAAAAAPQKNIVLTEVPTGLEVGIQMHGRYGTTESMYYPVREAENLAHRRTVKTHAAISEIKKGLPKNATNRIMNYAVGRQANGEAILRAHKITPVTDLSKAEMAAYDHMRGGLEKAFIETNRARVASGLQPFNKVNDYFTFYRAMGGLADEGYSLMTVTQQALNRKMRETPFGYKNRRSSSLEPLILDAFGVFKKYMGAAARHAELTPVVAKNHQMLNGKFYDGFSLYEANPQAYKHLSTWNDYVAGATPWKSHPLVEKGLTELNRNVAYAVLSYSARSAAIQPTAAVNTVTYLGPKWAAKGVQAVIPKYGKSIRRFIMANSEHLGVRKHDIYLDNLHDGLGSRLNRTKQRVAGWGTWLLQELDFRTAQAAWWGGYQKAKSMGFSKKQAVKYADDAVVRTQASAAREDISPIQRNAFGKSVTSLQTFVINNWNFLARDVAKIGRPKITNKAAFRDVMRYVIGATVVNSIYEDGIGMRSPLPAPISAMRRAAEEGDDDWKMLATAALEMVELYPFGGALRYQGNIFGTVAGVGEDVAEAARGDVSLERGLETAGKVIGIPGSTQMRKSIDYLQEQD